MDSLITAAARALAKGDPLKALNAVALRQDPPALALRGIAMAQLGDPARARMLLKRAARGFGAKEAVDHARCVVADAEIALVSRDLSWHGAAFVKARETLESRGDRVNAAHARYLEARLALLVGRLDDAEIALAALDPASLPPASQAVCALVEAGIAVRRLRTAAARSAHERARQAAMQAAIPALAAEVDSASRVLQAPAARLVTRAGARDLRLDEVEALLSSDAVVVDACRNVVRAEGRIVPLATRPVLFSLARSLAETWPGDADRAMLLSRAFRAKTADESHRARLRVEMGRLRKALQPEIAVKATRRGFALVPRGAGPIVVLAPLVDDEDGAVLALLADGEAWSSSSLAIALSLSPRTVLRSLDRLARAGKVQAIGAGRACRWTASPVLGFPPSLLLPGPLPGG